MTILKKDSPHALLVTSVCEPSMQAQLRADSGFHETGRTKTGQETHSFSPQSDSILRKGAKQSLPRTRRKTDDGFNLRGQRRDRSKPPCSRCWEVHLKLGNIRMSRLRDRELSSMYVEKHLRSTVPRYVDVHWQVEAMTNSSGAGRPHASVADVATRW